MFFIFHFIHFIILDQGLHQDALSFCKSARTLAADRKETAHLLKIVISAQKMAFGGSVKNTKLAAKPLCSSSNFIWNIFSRISRDKKSGSLHVENLKNGKKLGDGENFEYHNPDILSNENLLLNFAHLRMEVEEMFSFYGIDSTYEYKIKENEKLKAKNKEIKSNFLGQFFFHNKSEFYQKNISKKKQSEKRSKERKGNSRGSEKAKSREKSAKLFTVGRIDDNDNNIQQYTNIQTNNKIENNNENNDSENENEGTNKKRKVSNDDINGDIKFADSELDNSSTITSNVYNSDKINSEVRNTTREGSICHEYLAMTETESNEIFSLRMTGSFKNSVKPSLCTSPSISSIDTTHLNNEKTKRLSVIIDENRKDVQPFFSSPTSQTLTLSILDNGAPIKSTIKSVPKSFLLVKEYYDIRQENENENENIIDHENENNENNKKYAKTDIYHNTNSPKSENKKQNNVLRLIDNIMCDENSVKEFNNSEFYESLTTTEISGNIEQNFSTDDLSKKIQEALDENFQNSLSFKQSAPLIKKSRNKICCNIS